MSHEQKRLWEDDNDVCHFWTEAFKRQPWKPWVEGRWQDLKTEKPWIQMTLPGRELLWGVLRCASNFLNAKNKTLVVLIPLRFQRFCGFVVVVTITLINTDSKSCVLNPKTPTSPTLPFQSTYQCEVEERDKEINTSKGALFFSRGMGLKFLWSSQKETMRNSWTASQHTNKTSVMRDSTDWLGGREETDELRKSCDIILLQ